jgi:hypothetical protein
VSKSSWILTFSGRHFDPLNPRARDICIEDIAHALSLQCRFTGHVREFYGVGQHSVYVSEACCADHRLHGLMHDASEAYLCDIASPVKHHPGFAFYRKAEARVEEAVAKAFGLKPIDCDCVKVADARILATEKRDLMVSSPPWPKFNNPYEFTVTSWTPKRAEREFLSRFSFLSKRAA